MTIAGASTALHPTVADQPKCDPPDPCKLPAINQAIFAGDKRTAQFRWTKNSDGDDLLEIEMSGKIRWIEVLTTKQ